ncbi:MAG: ATP phosphoribosyltransferase, ATP phosphoribosyltransferase [Candidatus Gottesmanbacteria bacterium GW2011_GWA2_43_14]|uniref:ATP phosphoribosyltransferase n=1 Tax=Candidatus Gottesmanbacteria bacterium GW2011_GWA2_43_14 TaxID=1618443 RepID=A0A0G1FNT3_9BACT|nr:MAG: ATP phosphoribosyltransferase, ATP phosphoribosyltransferase [Candidatus Gottesmanbacteria bacterium GW2011_GWA2_43_14]
MGVAQEQSVRLWSGRSRGQNPSSTHMNKQSKENLILAVQKEGRLTEETLSFLWKAGLKFENYKNKLFITCRNFPLTILFVRINDIPDYITSQTADLGITGQNLLCEKRPIVSKLLNLRYGFCSLVIAVPKDSQIKKLQDLKNKKIATSYPESLINFLSKKRIKADIKIINGSVEIAPSIGLSDAVADLVSSGSTLASHDLKVLTKIYDSESVLISGKNISKRKMKSLLLKQLLGRFKSVLSAENYKCIYLELPENRYRKLKKIIPGIKIESAVSIGKNRLFISAVIKEDFIWNSLDKLKAIGSGSIYLQPLEKIINI